MKLVPVLLTWIVLIACGVEGLAPVITEGEKNLAIATILEIGEVREATIQQSSRIIFLTLVVDETTTLGQAKVIGETFVLLTKSFGPDASPIAGDLSNDKVGAGIFSYVISVVNPNQEAIASGIKAQGSSRIDW